MKIKKINNHKKNKYVYFLNRLFKNYFEILFLQKDDYLQAQVLYFY